MSIFSIARCRRAFTALVCMALPVMSWADSTITNTASVTFTGGSANSNQVSFAVLVNPVVTGGSTTGTVNVPFNFTVLASGNQIVSYGATGLPAGLSINSANGTISGTPTTAVTNAAVTLSATNAAGGTGTATLTITINPAGSISLTKSFAIAGGKTAAKSGDVVTFTIAYTNTSTSQASNVVIADGVPAGSTLVANSLKINGVAGGSVSGTNLTWSIGTVAGSGTGNVSFQVTVQ